MNPPSALHGAMSRDRKPFTYTPGGLDLSEIKSERMAKRLMRNAMNQGVPETPAHHFQSQQAPTSPVIVPNYNCLPVQVFPSFNLPANPKSLLRTRSIPSQSQEPPVPRLAPPSQFVNSTETPGGDSYDTFSRPTQPYTQINKNRPASMYEYSTTPSNPYYALPNYNIAYSSPTLPEISYDAQYLSSPEQRVTPIERLPEPQKFIPAQEVTKPVDIINDEKPDTVIEVIEKPQFQVIDHLSANTLAESNHEVPTTEESIDDESELKVSKKIVKKEQKSSEQNGDQNGDTNIEAELTVKLPTKKSSAKTETKVEVVKKVLPDGSVEEVKTTTTKTTIDGRTEIKTKTETTTIPKDDEEEVEEIEEEEEEEQGNGQVVVEELQDEKEEEVFEEPPKDIKKVEEKSEIKENGQNDSVIKTEERSGSTTTTTKRVVIVQSDKEPSKEIEEEKVEEEEEEEEEEIQEPEPVTVVKKKTEKLETPPPEPEEEEDEQVLEEKEEEKEEIEEDTIKKQEIIETKSNNKLEEEEEVSTIAETVKSSKPEEEEEELEEEEEYEEAEEEADKAQQEVKEVKVVEKVEDNVEEPIIKAVETKPEDETDKPTTDVTESIRTEETIKEQVAEQRDVKEQERIILIERPEAAPETETKVPLREPSIPMDKVEDVEIKPIGPPGVITKTHTEKTEIITRTSPQPPGILSTQTEYNKVENIVTVNRTINTLDNTFEGIAPSVPDVKTYFAPNRDRILASPMPSRPYQPVYPPEPQTERRHSLLLERLSVERQMPSEIYHNQTCEQQRQWSQEPQSEILTISNVKPSSINKQQWYQQKDTSYNNIAPTPPVAPTPSWSQPQLKPQPQPTYKPQPTYAPQQTYQPSPIQQTYQPSPTPQIYQPSPTPQPTYQPPPTPQPTYQSTPTPQPQYQVQTTPQPQYQSSYTDTIQNNSSSSYSTYTTKPTIWPPTKFEPASTPTPQPTHYTSESYQKSTQQYNNSSSYVPPPWEQDSSYVTNNSAQNYYQPPPTNTFTPTPAPAQSWKPPAPKGKYTKPVPTAYIPPAPNQSFVKPVSSADTPRGLPGRKTYYSEYERRYISVPEANYIPQETKYQPQPDPSPQYYYDNNEPSEAVEPQWRKELREFTEKTSQTQTQTEMSSVRPPWEVDTKYAKTPEPTFTQAPAPTPTWSQTLRPRSWREKSFESEFVGSQEWPKTGSLGRGRPLYSYAKNESSLERTRGVSVDRYNPNNYQSPTSLEHPPVQTHTLNPNLTPHTGYHNPNVPAYHARASAEPREQPVSYKQPRTVVREPRANPLQSRSFKYLQWITGTDD